ncbi:MULTISPECIES: zinc ABC transporter ATP-binding protein AztA [Bordetella]|uniref:ABC transporter n=3 Tax=Bordetella TaxID=517 RepID=A0ABX4FCZ1_9BORD|nr:MULTISPECIES: zinc ABC transporter ATP-binding protein AztA [Bordetella]AOB24920.1 ABC transporter [Bordetella bronchiseptica]AZW19902.1 metal ABC transporter ATP-binding protein [Bordetella bronchiseptica]AZW42155.1 metal ABC transporter ATP-binding protein [Bordetella bronchiseptica]KDC10517.1 ABC transporter, ATP-binding protein [Bordetella bronchiseptica E012]OZI70411.1 ABC transporter [Bordetella genomosp. 6]
MAMTAPGIALRGAAFGWRGRAAVHGLTGEFSRGSMTAIVGPNGAGKSTLLKGLAGVLRPLAGKLECEADLRRRLAWLPQAAEVERGFPITVADMVALGAWRRVGAWRRFDADETARVHAALRRVGLQDLAGQALATLSGGQMQRALFARLLLQDAPLLLLDEPFSAIDAATTDVLLDLLREQHAEGRTVIAVLHDLDLVRRHFPRTLLLAGRQVAWCETGQALGAANLARARGLAMREAA